MKAIKFFSVLSIVTIIAGTTAIYSVNNPNNKSQKPGPATIRYEVAIHFSFGISPCNTYLVQVTDETGRLVAPPKIFIPGTSKYVFNELFSVPARVRIASLVLPNNMDPFICPNFMITKPDVEMGPFLPGRIVSFNLYPEVLKSTIRE
jgi:hypothetical protein